MHTRNCEEEHLSFKAAVTHIFSLLLSLLLSLDPPKKWKKPLHGKRGTHEKFSNPKISFTFFNSNPLSALFTFFSLGEIAGWSQEAPSKGHNRARP